MFECSRPVLYVAPTIEDKRDNFRTLPLHSLNQEKLKTNMNTTISITLLILSLFAAQAAQGQQPVESGSPSRLQVSSQDFTGFQETRWSMTGDDLLKIYGDKVTKSINDRGNPIANIKEIEIENEKFSVLFFLKKGSETVHEVLVRGDGKDYTTDASTYEKFKSILKRKHGEPISSSNGDSIRPSVIRKTEWSTHNSLISLKFVRYPTSALVIEITYEKKGDSL